MSDKLTIYLQGNISDGFQALGPFIDFEDCCEKCDGLEGWVMELTRRFISPNGFHETPPDHVVGENMETHTYILTVTSSRSREETHENILKTLQVGVADAQDTADDKTLDDGAIQEALDVLEMQITLE